MASVRFHLSPVCDLGLGYKFLAAFHADGTIMTHAAWVNFAVRF